MPLGRTFSFDNDDEGALSHNEQERLSYQTRNDGDFQPYNDSPSRDIISPPPQYFSPSPPEPPSPIMSPTPAARQYPRIAHHGDALHPEERQGGIPRKAVPSGRESLESLELPPPPPPHGRRPSADPSQDERYWGSQGGYAQASPGIIDRQRRDSGSQAGASPSSRPEYLPSARDRTSSSSEIYSPHRMNQAYPELRQRDSHSSGFPLAAGAATPGSMTPGGNPDLRSSGISGRSIPLEDYPAAYPTAGVAPYLDSPYQTSSMNYHSQVNQANINPNNIEDDGDDGFMPDPRRKSMLNRGRVQSSEIGGGAAAGAATTGGVMGALGGLMGRRQKAPTSSGTYDPVEITGNAGSKGADGNRAEKSEWLSRQTQGNNKMRWVVGFAIGAVVVLAIIGGIVGGVLGSHNNNNSSSGSSSGSGNSDNTAAGDTAANGDLDATSPEIQALLNNKNLHKVFPGMDYTPWGTQYPLCLTYPPSQNNVTRDMAVLSQLTNAVRLYGTDCNQTEMVLHAIDRLKLTDMKVWLGVWIDTNDTTTERQLAQMYKIIEDTSDLSIYKGAIVGNEALYRAGLDKASSEASLIQILTDVKANFTAKGWNIPVATSDLGDNWNAQLVEVCDMVMSNVHPFFAGVTAAVAAGWTWDFWQNNDVVLTAGTSKQQIISETGWPSAGGTDCGGTTGDCTPGQSGSIAGIDEMNTYMDTWVCQAMANKTEYFWFEAFDESWKIVYDTPGKDWEDKWGLMDAGRNLKAGLTIPDCGGKTVS